MQVKRNNVYLNVTFYVVSFKFFVDVIFSSYLILSRYRLCYKAKEMQVSKSIHIISLQYCILIFFWFSKLIKEKIGEVVNWVSSAVKLLFPQSRFVRCKQSPLLIRGMLKEYFQTLIIWSWETEMVASIVFKQVNTTCCRLITLNSKFTVSLQDKAQVTSELINIKVNAVGFVSNEN